MGVIDSVLKTMETLKKAATKKGMVSTAAEIDTAIQDLRSKRANQYVRPIAEEQLCDQLQQIADETRYTVNSMSSEEISLDNNDYTFKRYPLIHDRANSGTGLLELHNRDSRDLSIAYSNAFVLSRFADTYEESDRIYNDESTNGKYVIDVPHDQILLAMSWMADLAVKKSPKWVKSNCRIQKEALASHESLIEFMKTFSKKHDIFWPKD